MDFHNILWILLSIVTPLVLACFNEKPKDILTILKEPFKMSNVQFVDLERSNKTFVTIDAIKLMKHTFQEIQVISVSPRFDSNSKYLPVAVCADRKSSLDQLSMSIDSLDLAIHNPLLVFTRQPELALEHLNSIKVDQEVYVISTKDFSVWETYAINGIIVKNFLGKYSSQGDYAETDIGKQNFEERRQNFKGNQSNCALIFSH